jgi:hypothetical protein
MALVYNNRKILGVTAPLNEWVLLGLVVVLSIALALVVDIQSAISVIQGAGYWQMLAMVVGAGWFLFKYLRKRLPLYRRWYARAPRGRVFAAAALIVSASVFMHLQFPHQYKVLADEATQMNTSQALQQHRLVYTPGTANYRNGIFLVGEGFFDKRPYLFPFLLSVMHDLTGYRYTNSIWLNALLTPFIILLFFMLGRRIHRGLGGGAAVLLAIGVPIFAHTATGGGFESLNLVLLLSSFYFALRIWQQPSREGVGLLVMCACLLGYARYESVLYVLPVGVTVWMALGRPRSASLPWILYLAPLLCIPLVWLQRIAFSQQSMYFQLAYHQDPSAFSASFLHRNLLGAWRFFFVPNPVYLSSPLITVLGVAGAVVLVRILLKKRLGGGRGGRCEWTLMMFLLATIANAIIFLFFNYGQYDEYITQRISIPVFALFLILGVYLVSVFSALWARWAIAGLVVVNILVFYMPAAHGNFYSKEYINGKDFQFVQDYNKTLGAEEGVFIYTHNRTAWLCARRPGLTLREATKDVNEIYNVIDKKRYSRILVHVFEYSPEIWVSDMERNRPPVWFNIIEKKQVAHRWISSGVVVAIYEVMVPTSYRALTNTQPNVK